MAKPYRFRKPLEDFVGYPLSETVVKESTTEPRQITQNAIQDFLDCKELVGDEIFSGLDLFCLLFFGNEKK